RPYFRLIVFQPAQQSRDRLFRVAVDLAHGNHSLQPLSPVPVVQELDPLGEGLAIVNRLLVGWVSRTILAPAQEGQRKTKTSSQDESHGRLLFSNTEQGAVCRDKQGLL